MTPLPKGKDIVLLIDGTRQGPEDPRSNPSNVEGLGYFLRASSLRRASKVARSVPGATGLLHPGVNGATGYLSGIGAETMHVPRIFPAASGAGMAHMIRIAYRFLSQHYEQGDRIFLFGFSRGAFAARSLAGFVDCVGLALSTLPPSALNQAIDDAYYIYEFLRGDADAIRKGITHHLKGGSRSENDVRDLEWVSLPIYFIGIWDAVEALGLPAEAKAVTRVFNSYHQTRLPPNITHAAHALSLHELRSEFRPHLWNDKLPQQTLVQRWFPGDHSDIGGGHSGRGLASISFSWMMSRARSAGLFGLDSLISFADTQGSDRTQIQQMWHTFPYSFLEPKIREEVRRFSGPNRALVLGHEIDPSATMRLLSGTPDDYGRFMGNSLLFSAPNLQVDLLRQIDSLTASA
jgi:uncharacterized protein (DUF2235 family)